jgi:type VI secretion system Hcp family effector
MKYLAFILFAAGATAFRAAPDPGVSVSAGAPAVSVKTYMSVKGARQGVFKGQNSKGGRESEGWFEIMSFSFGVENPTSKAQSGGGKRAHSPINIRKQVDAASPKLLESLNTRETLEVVIQSVGPDNKVIKNITLRNAIVTGIHKDDWENVSFEYTDIVEQP